jgi:hypothetical protein
MKKSNLCVTQTNYKCSAKSTDEFNSCSFYQKIPQVIGPETCIYFQNSLCLCAIAQVNSTKQVP